MASEFGQVKPFSPGETFIMVKFYVGVSQQEDMAHMMGLLILLLLVRQGQLDLLDDSILQITLG